MKLIVILIFSTIALMFLGCSENEIDCDNIPEFSEQDIGEIYVSQSQNGEPIGNIAESIFYIDFLPEEREISSFFRGERSITHFSYSFFSKANATSCLESKYRETVTNINITSDSDFDEMYLAGQSLNDIFTVSFYLENIEESLYGAPLFTSGISLSMRNLPTLAKTHNFKFELSLDSEKTFIIELENVVFE